MRFGTNSFASMSFGDSDLDSSSTPAVTDLIANQELPRNYLFHATPYDPVGAAETDVRASIGLTHPILDSVAWPAYLKTAVDSQIDLFGNDENSQGRSSFGNIELLIGDAEHDDIVDYYWDGRDVEIKLGGDGFDIADYVTVLSGTAKDAVFDKRRLGIVFRGKEEFLDKPISDDDTPLCFGQVFNISPLLLDRATSKYQFHDGSVEAVSSAYDGGGALTSLGDVADIDATTVAAGYYKTQLSGGYIKLGAPPEKALTIDVKGDNNGGYVETASDIIKRICLNYTDLTEADLNMWSFFTARLDASRSRCGVYDTGGSVNQTIADLMFSIGGAYAFNREGKLTLSVFRLRKSSGTITEDDIISDSFKRVQTASPSWERRLGYGKSWTVQSEDQLIGSPSSTRVNFVVDEYRYATDNDAGIKDEHAGARVVRKDTLLMFNTEANTEAVRQQSMFGGNPRRFDLIAKRQQFRYSVGDTVNISYSRFSIDEDMIILGIRENTNSRRTTFRLFAP